MEPILRGTAVSSGVAHGTAYVITRADGAVVPSRTLDEAEVEAELNRFDLALARAESDLTALSKSVGERIGIGEADIFGAQALLVRDHGLHDQVVALVRQKRVNAEAALSEVIEKLVRAFDGIPDVRLRERSADIRDVGNRIFEALTADDGCVLCQVPEGSILIADELLPSATAGVELNRVRALVTDRGGKFSHTSILARSMRMPAVTGISEAVLKIKTGDHVIVDAVAGTVWIDPDAPTRRDTIGWRPSFATTAPSSLGRSIRRRSRSTGCQSG